jgi:hypothetical protein
MGPDKMIREEGYDMCFKRLVFFCLVWFYLV